LEPIIAINRIDYFTPVLKEDYDLVKSSIKDFKPKYIAWNYGAFQDALTRGLIRVDYIGNNILIGNSATDTNNHLEAFEF